MSGKVIITWSFKLVETLPAASFAKAYNVLVPSVEKVYVVGAVTCQPASLASGVDVLSVNK